MVNTWQSFFSGYASLIIQFFNSSFIQYILGFVILLLIIKIIKSM